MGTVSGTWGHTQAGDEQHGLVHRVTKYVVEQLDGDLRALARADADGGHRSARRALRGGAWARKVCGGRWKSLTEPPPRPHAL